MSGGLGTAFMLLSAMFLLLAAAGVWSSIRWFLGAEDSSASPLLESHDRSSKLDEKQALLRQIKDLEFEKEVGKLSDEDFIQLNQEFRTRARLLIGDLDKDIRPFVEKAGDILAEVFEKHEATQDAGAQDLVETDQITGTDPKEID